MRDYARVAPQFWTGTTGKVLREAGREVQVVALYLITCPSANMIGLYYLPLPTLCHEVGIPLQGARKALRRASEGGFAYYDEAAEHIWVPEMARFQLGEQLKPGDNRIQAVIRELLAAKSSRFAQEFYDKYRERFHLPDLPKLKPLRSPWEGPSEPLRSQEQEQEHEQKQEQEQDVGATAPSLETRPDRREAESLGEHSWPSPEVLVALYNSAAPPECSKVTKLSAGRRTKAKKYLDLFPDRDFWEKAIAEIGLSTFLRGHRNGTGHEGFKADLDWLLSNGKDGTENVVKVAEGRYRDRASGEAANRRTLNDAWKGKTVGGEVTL
jgi:hypothetical protein